MDPQGRERFLAQKRPTPFFEGSLTVRIHEADGAPFEHLVDVKTNKKTFPLPFNTKYKRTRRSGHVAARFSKLQDALAQAEDNDEDQEAELRDLDRGEVFAYPPWDDEDEQRKWRVHDWSEEEAQAMLGEGGGYEWIRVDPDLEWLASFEIHEKPWFWISQLQGDRDVVAQLQVGEAAAFVLTGPGHPADDALPITRGCQRVDADGVGRKLLLPRPHGGCACSCSREFTCPRQS
jgi:transcription initiation factor TFIID subunit 2